LMMLMMLNIENLHFLIISQLFWGAGRRTKFKV
jgi:hypothetical protein